MNMNRTAVKRSFRIAQLLVSGAIIGLYIAKGFGIFGVEITQVGESIGAALGASSVVLLKIIHLV